MEQDLAPHAAALLSRQILEAQLRDAYPYLKNEALESLLNKTSILIESEISRQVPIMAATRARINFFSLSPELRNRIYEIALDIDANEPPEVCIQLGCREMQPETKKFLTPKLLQISKQIRLEAAPLLYGNVLFSAVFSSHRDPFGRYSDAFLDQTIARDYIRLIGAEHSGLIRHFCLRLEGNCINRLHYLWYHFNGHELPATETAETRKRMALKALELEDVGLKDGNIKAGTKMEIGGDLHWLRLGPWKPIETLWK